MGVAKITVKFKLETPLHIGAGIGSSFSSVCGSSILLNSKLVPYIPGSSFKGVLRTGMERLVRSFNIEKSCGMNAHKLNWKKRNNPCGNCITCDLFGSMNRGGKIFVDDVVLEGSEIEEVKHYSGSKGRFFSEQICYSDQEYELNITIENNVEIMKEEVGLLLLTLDLFNEDLLHIGGNISRGRGRIRVTKVTCEGFDGNDCMNKAIIYLQAIKQQPLNKSPTEVLDFSLYNIRSSKIATYILTANFNVSPYKGKDIFCCSGRFLNGSFVKGAIKKKVKNTSYVKYINEGRRSGNNRKKIVGGDKLLVGDFRINKSTYTGKIVLFNVRKELVDEMKGLKNVPIKITDEKKVTDKDLLSTSFSICNSS